ncbi:MAG: MoxR family ATPase [Epsilonproteobacteria bacterium]|nr:MoxR family ATPase [Campylobacterota bacterium]
MITQIKKELQKVIIGQEKMIDALLIGLLSNGHILLEGVPGLAKTLSIKTLAQILDLDFKRIQFTPDLLPSDIIGVEIYDMKTGQFKTKKGPIFANLLLADEINRAAPKVQSALLEAMAERQVTIADNNFPLSAPFLVMATQNPIDQEGTYMLPQAQLDRFMLKAVIGYNTKQAEIDIIKSQNTHYSLDTIATQEDIFTMQEQVKNVHIDDELVEYIAELVQATRIKHRYIEFGCSTRGGISLFQASKAVAFMEGRDYVTPIDILSIVKDVFRHRIIISYEAQADNVSVDKIIEEIVSAIKVP